MATAQKKDASEQATISKSFALHSSSSISVLPRLYSIASVSRAQKKTELKSVICGESKLQSGRADLI
jgi:hypothetical protein